MSTLFLVRIFKILLAIFIGRIAFLLYGHIFIALESYIIPYPLFTFVSIRTPDWVIWTKIMSVGELNLTIYSINIIMILGIFLGCFVKLSGLTAKWLIFISLLLFEINQSLIVNEAVLAYTLACSSLFTYYLIQAELILLTDVK